MHTHTQRLTHTVGGPHSCCDVQTNQLQSSYSSLSCRLQLAKHRQSTQSGTLTHTHIQRHTCCLFAAKTANLVTHSQTAVELCSNNDNTLGKRTANYLQSDSQSRRMLSEKVAIIMWATTQPMTGSLQRQWQRQRCVRIVKSTSGKQEGEGAEKRQQAHFTPICLV